MAKLVGEMTEKEFDELQNKINENFEKIRSMMSETNFIFINQLFMGTCLKDCSEIEKAVFRISKEGKDDDTEETNLDRDSMKLHALMRTYVVEDEEITEVLGVYDADHIKEAIITAESIYNPREIWVDDFELNSMDIYR